MNIYLDYQATTPCDPAVVEAMQPFWSDQFGNPHSQHRFGWTAHAAIEAARAKVASLAGVEPDRVVFTSGATEANNLALKGVLARSRRGRIVTVATEHSCVLESARYLERRGCELTVLSVGRDGLVDLDAAAEAITNDVALVSVMLVNNEIGVIQPVAEIARLARTAGAVMHCDAAQAFGKLPVAGLGVDLLSVTAHKMYGPKGVGALIVAPGVELEPQMHGGGQEGGGLRSGTLPTPLVVGFGKAAEISGERMAADHAHVERLWGLMLGALEVPHSINGSVSDRWRGNLNVQFNGVDGDRLLADLRSLSVSSGAACASAAGRHSHVLEALGLSRREAKASLRIGWGRFTTEEEVAAAAAMINDAVRRQLRDAA